MTHWNNNLRSKEEVQGESRVRGSNGVIGADVCQQWSETEWQYLTHDLIGVGKPTGRRTLRAGGFTLIELLIVIAIIAILMSLMLPALNMAKESGYQALCIGNQKQIFTSLSMYSGDYNGFIAPLNGLDPWYGIDKSGGAVWSSTLAYMKYISGVPVDNKNSEPMGVYRCPSEHDLTVKPDNVWRCCHYAINSSFYFDGLGHTIWNRLINMPHPATFAVLSDKVENRGIYPSYHCRNRVKLRHSYGAVFVFGDGHGEKISAMDICKGIDPAQHGKNYPIWYSVYKKW